MAGRSKPTTVEPQPITGADPAYPTASLVASAVRYSGKTARIYNPSQHWQREAYRHYGICGEARFGAQFFANSMSRATLYSATVGSDGELTRETSGAGPENLRRIFGPQTSPQNLAAIGLHLTIAGECYLVGREHHVPDFDPTSPEDGDAGEVWEVVSTLEMEVTGDKWQINYHNGRMPVELTDDDIIIRIWRPDPEKRIEADSPFRSLLPVLREIEALTLHMFAQTQSRLAGAGILFLPQGMTFPQPVDADGKPVEVSNEAEGFMRVVADTMMAVKGDQGNPASLVPIMVTAPDEAIDKARLMHFWSELDEKAMEMRNGAIHRFALGMDLPPEQVLGMGSNLGTGGGTSNGISHWGAWQVDEQTVTLHIEPMLELVCAAVTVSFLRPATDGTRVARFDTQSLRLRPDRSKESIELFDRGLIKGSVVVRENGFKPEDMMTNEDRKQWLLVKIASGSATPEQVQGALYMLGINLPELHAGNAHDQPPDDVTDDTRTPRESRPVPSLEDHEVRREPDRAAALLHISEALVLRGLERAGNRLRASCKGEAPKTPSFETHCVVPVKDPNYLLEDAWSTAGIVLAGVAEPGEVVPVLDAYCKMLFSQQMAHSRTRLAKWLEAQS